MGWFKSEGDRLSAAGQTVIAFDFVGCVQLRHGSVQTSTQLFRSTVQCLAIKKNGVLLFAAKWMEPVILC